MKKLFIALLFIVLSIPTFGAIDNDTMVKAAKAAHPIYAPMSDDIMGSSSQISYNGKRYTLTNLHLCVQYSYDEDGINIAPYNSLMIDKTRVQVLALAPEHDLCLLEPIPGADFIELSFFTPKIHDEIFIVGHPRGMKQTIREGRIVDDNFQLNVNWILNPQRVNTMMISAISYGGNSGSPVLNKSGFLVGVLFAGPSHYHTEALIVPLKEIKQFLRRVEEYII